MTRLAHVVVIAAVVALTACSGKGSPAAPTPPQTTPPAPTLVALTGTVSNANSARIQGAAVRIDDGLNAGKSATTDGNGTYRFDGLTVGNANLTVSATNYLSTGGGVFINGTNALNFVLQLVPIPPPPPPPPPPLFKKSGTGDTVFNIPSHVQIIKIAASYSGYSSNFVVYIASDLIVNELIGVGWGTTKFSGSYLTNGGIVQITHSSGVAWSFTEVR